MCISRSAIILALTIALSALPALQQEPRFAQVPAEPSGADPFAISIGSSFSASTGSSGGRSGSGRGVSTAIIDLDFHEALRTVLSNHVNSGMLDGRKLTDASIESMLRMLDPHSNYYTPEQFQDLLGEHESRYSGTGSSIAGFLIEGRVETFVISTFPGSPAARAGLRFGDRILGVNGQDMRGCTPDAVRAAVRGQSGTRVAMTVERADGRKIEKLEVRRELVKEPAVPAGIVLGRNTGYIDLTKGFSNATFNEFEAALGGLRRRGVTSLILDLRGNGGGILQQAVKVAEKFLPAGSTIVSQRGRYPSEDRVWRAERNKYEKLPLVVLVDSDTASAAEVLAGTLQDNDRAVLIGQKTFGKGLVQSVLDLPAGAGLTLTAARYYLPTGRSIQREYAGKGIYDYYHDRGRDSSIGIPLFAAKTPTGRVVYDGDGITPDLPSAPEPVTDEQISLLDLVFPFVRNSSEARASINGPVSDGAAGDAISREAAKLFDLFLKENAASAKTGSSIAANREFVEKMIGYYFAMAVAGPEEARNHIVRSDPQVKRAGAAADRAAILFANAQRSAASRREKEKDPPSQIHGGQR
ncbi:MAG: S41 family peptidase [Pyrinomonadaceae bacterium]